MQKALLALALATTGFTALPVIAHAAEDNSGFFINGQVGRSKMNNYLIDDTDTAFGINGGYRWGWFGVELGYIDLGKFQNDFHNDVVNSGDMSLSGFNLGVNGHFNLNENWYLSGRVGAFRYHAKATYDVYDLDFQGQIHVSENSIKPYAGVGFGYDFTNNFGIGLNYDHYWTKNHGAQGSYNDDLNSDLISFSAEYRFH